MEHIRVSKADVTSHSSRIANQGVECKSSKPTRDNPLAVQLRVRLLWVIVRIYNIYDNTLWKSIWKIFTQFYKFKKSNKKIAL